MYEAIKELFQWEGHIKAYNIIEYTSKKNNVRG